MSGSVTWSSAYLLRSGHHVEIGERIGVYRIRAFDVTVSPIRIARLKGEDPLGILHIGQSVRLGVRVREFRQAAEGLRAPHAAGQQFVLWGFVQAFPLEGLHFDYATVGTSEDAVALERECHEMYRRQYLDRPPLDAHSGMRQR